MHVTAQVIQQRIDCGLSHGCMHNPQDVSPMPELRTISPSVGAYQKAQQLIMMLASNGDECSLWHQKHTRNCSTRIDSCGRKLMIWVVQVRCWLGSLPTTKYSEYRARSPRIQSMRLGVSSSDLSQPTALRLLETASENSTAWQHHRISRKIQLLSKRQQPM